MPRSRISPDLGRLPHVPVLKDPAQKIENLRQLLRSLAIKNQREQPRIFYSLREVAIRFKIPVSSVAKIYREMEQEGILSRVRGSKTVLNGLRHSRRLTVRSFIGLPVLFSHFLTMPEYRAFFISIRRELWSRGFATSMFFSRPEEIADGTLGSQLKNYEVDTVIWLQPGRITLDTLLRLSDMGIQVIVISQVGTPGIPSRYYVWKNRAIEGLLRNWKDQNSIRKVTVINSETQDYRSPVTEELLRVILEYLQIEPTIRTFRDEDGSCFLRDLSSVKTDAVIFPSAGLASAFAFQSPDQLLHLIKTHRVGFVDGSIDMPFIKVPEVAVDLVTVNWRNVCESIVNDLITRDAFDRNRHTTFEAEMQLRVSLRHFCEEIRPARGIAASV